MRAIYNGGIKTKILLTLRNYGDSKRASFVNRLAEHHRQSVDRALLWLLQEGYIEQYQKAPKARARKVRYLTLTDKGRQAIKQLEEEHGEMPPNQALVAIRRDERKELVMNVYSACRAMGMMVDEDEKPNLSLLIDRTQEADASERAKIDEMQTVGAYYSLTEIRKTAREMYGSGPLNQTRCIGVIIRNKRIFFLYNMGGKLIYYNSTVERKTKEEILGLFENSKDLRETMQFSLKREAPCILFAKSYGSIAQLFFKRHAGSLPVDEKTGTPVQRKGKWEPNRDRLSIDVLEEIFTEIYFVPLRDTDNVLASVTSITPARAQTAVNRWVAQQDTLRAISDGSGAQAVEKASGNRVFVWLDSNLRTLHTVWKSRLPVYVVVPMSGPENGIAKVLGTRLLNIQAIGGELLRTKQYDDFGNLKRNKEDARGDIV